MVVVMVVGLVGKTDKSIVVNSDYDNMPVVTMMM
jgi:hypothetical protein